MSSHALIFGASGGIASALTQRLLASGWTVTAATRSPEALAASELLHPVRADGTTESGVEDAFAAAASIAPVTAVVNGIGNVFLKPVHRTSPAEFTEVMRLHVFSSFLILNRARTRLSRDGTVALVSSVAARTGLPHHETISAAKGAIEGLVRASAASWAGQGIRVNAVAPGLTETPATAAWCKPPAREVSEKLHPLGRIGAPDDIASALAWLIDPAQSWVTGQILHVDGGLGALRGPSGR